MFDLLGNALEGFEGFSDIVKNAVAYVPKGLEFLSSFLLKFINFTLEFFGKLPSPFNFMFVGCLSLGLVMIVIKTFVKV